MLLPIIYQQQYSDLKQPLSSYTKEVETVLTDSKHDPRFLTENIPPHTELGSFGKKIIDSGDAYQESTTLTEFSDNYKNYNARSLLIQIKSELNNWINFGTDEAIVHISRIKSALSKHEAYLDEKPSHRLLLAGLELLFKNNAWENIDSRQLTHLSRILDQSIRAGEINKKDVNNFIKNMQSSSFKIMSNGYSDEKIKEKYKEVKSKSTT